MSGGDLEGGFSPAAPQQVMAGPHGNALILAQPPQSQKSHGNAQLGPVTLNIAICSPRTINPCLSILPAKHEL